MNRKLKKRLEALEQRPGSLLQEIRDGRIAAKQRLPIMLTGVVGMADLKASRCTRTLCSNGTLMDYVRLDDGHGNLASRNGLSDEELNRWIESFPIEVAGRVADEALSARNRATMA